MNINRNILKSMSYIFFSRVLDILLSFTTLAIIARSLSLEDMGVFQQYQIFIVMIGFFYFNGLGGAASQSIARGFSGTFFTARKLSFLLSLFGSIISLILYFYYDDFIYIIISLLFPFSYGLNMWAKYYEGNGQVKLIAVGNNVTSLLLLFFVGVLYLLDFIRIDMLVFAYLLSKSLINVSFYFYIKKSENIKVEKSSIMYGIKISFYSYYNVIANNIDKLLIMTFLTPMDLAIYVIADKFPEAAKSMIQSLNIAFMNKFSKLNNLTKEIRTKIKYFNLALVILIIVFAIVLLPYLIIFSFGEKYVDSIFYAQVLMLSIVFTVPATVSFTFIRSKLDSTSFKNVQLQMSLARIIATSILIPLYGLNGAIISTVIYRISMLFIVNRQVKKYHLN